MSARITTDDHLTADPNDGVHNAGTSRAHLRVANHEQMIRRTGEQVSTIAGVFTTYAPGPAATNGRFR